VPKFNRDFDHCNNISPYYLAIFYFSMNKRLIAVGIFLGIAIGIAFFVGCPNKAIGCLAFDIGR
jgi:hypothetical protein